MTGSASDSTLSIVILAAGAGRRMHSDLPKPLHRVAGRSMLEQVVHVARQLSSVDITIVGSEQLTDLVEREPWAAGIEIAVQRSPRGTADAMRVALDTDLAGSAVLVLYADHPLVTAEMGRMLIAACASPGARIGVLTCDVEDAAGYGRIDRDEEGRIVAIVERVADRPEMRVGATEINSGLMTFDRDWAKEAIPSLKPHPPNGEYFLTDLAALAAAQRAGSAIGVKGPPEVLIGINDRAELAVADSHLRQRKRLELMEGGVTLLAPETNLIDLDVEIGPDTTIGPFCVLESGTRAGAHCRIGPNVVIRRSSIGERVHIESSTVEDSSVGNDSDVGPYAHIRYGSIVGQHVHVGNYAELKNADIGDGVRVGHFSYIGDATLGQDVNIGAGTVTCNFDGVNKHRTEIGAGAFIGSDTMLIAPITIGAGARTGAGAVVTRDVASGATVVGMPARKAPRSSSKAIDERTGGAE